MTISSGSAVRRYAMAGGALLWASSARAEPLLEVGFEAPSECPSRDALDAELARLLGDAMTRGTPMSAKVRVTAANPGYRLRLELKQSQQRSQRTLEGASCETLLETAALLIAIAHDPSAVVERRDAPLIPEPPPTPPAPPMPPPPVVTVEAPRPALSLPWAWTTPVPLPPIGLGFVLRAGPLFGVGDLPGPHPGVAIAAALRVEAFRVEGAFELGLGATPTLDARPGVGADFFLAAGVLRGCRVIVPVDGGAFPRPPLGVDFSGCLGIELGALTGEGFGVSNPERGSAFWAAPRVDVRLGLGLAGPFGLAADVGLAVPVDGRRYVLHDSGDGSVLVVHEPAVVAGRAGIMAEIEL
jgi:hypothetical protein